MSLSKDNEKLNIIAEWLLAFVGIWSAVEVFLSSFEVAFMGNAYVLYCFAISIVLYGVFKCLSGRTFKIATVGVYIAIIIVGIAGSAFLQYGMYGLINAMNIGIELNEYISYEFLLMYITMFIGVNISLSVVKGKSVVAAVCVLPVLSPCVLFGKIPSAFALTLMFVFFIGMSIYKKGNAVYTLGIFVTIAVIYVTVIMIFPAKDHKNVSWLYRLGELIQSEETEQPVKAHGGIGAGKLGSVDKLEFKHEKALTLQTGYSGSVYLKGFSAGAYKDNSWDPLDENIYSEYKDVFDASWYTINIYNQQAELFGILDNESELTAEIFGSTKDYFKSVLYRDYIVKYDGDASRGYWYMPYGNRYSVGNKNEKDGYPVDCEKGYIAGTQYICTDAEYDKFALFLKNYSGDSIEVNDYIKWEKAYREFVNDAYTGVSGEVKKAIINAKYEVPTPGKLNTMEQRLEYADELRAYFADHFAYTLEPGAVPEGEDFFKYFMCVTNKGYCTYYATAATLILRNAGIPARYAEGYVVDSSDAGGSFKETQRYCRDYVTIDKYKQRTVDVYDDNAHAWVEIYIDGFGWIPIEFTPGYSNSNQTVGDDVVAEEDNQLKEDETSDEYADDEVEVQTEPIVPVEKEYTNLKDYLRDHTIVDLDEMFYIMWLEFVRFLIVLLKIAAVLLVIAIIIYIPSHISMIRKRRLFTLHTDYSAEQTNKQIIAIYAYLYKLCRFLKIKRTDTMSGEAYVRSMKEKQEYFEEADVENVIYVIEKISYGRGNVGNDEMKRAINSINIVHKRSYEELEWWKKLLYRFVWHLY